MQTLSVDLDNRSYPIYIGEHLLEEPHLLKQHIVGQQVLVVSNPTVAALYLNPLKQALTDYQCNVVLVPDGEQYKTLTTLNMIFDALLAEKHSRKTTIIALGGGVVGDLAGFAAACYQRGVAFIQVPTTLLAQVDSAVGGKTGVNHPLGKNMIGAFHQPRCVITDVTTLKSLPPREFSAGIAEVVKYGLIQDVDFFNWLVTHMPKLMIRDPKTLVEAIAKSCKIKAGIVAQDEHESGLRAILNLGHTFGHAIETATDYKTWLHGEAVAIGMLMAADLSMRLGWLTQDDILQIKRLLISANLPTMLPQELSVEHFLTLMALDKKNINNQLRLILLKTIGQADIVEHVQSDLLKQTLTTYISNKGK